jgi:hypothetical protein
MYMAEDAAGAKESAPKRKKINKLKAADLNAKIDLMEKEGHTRSRYYRHLLARKNELAI